MKLNPALRLIQIHRNYIALDKGHSGTGLIEWMPPSPLVDGVYKVGIQQEQYRLLPLLTLDFNRYLTIERTLPIIVGVGQIIGDPQDDFGYTYNVLALIDEAHLLALRQAAAVSQLSQPTGDTP